MLDNSVIRDLLEKTADGVFSLYLHVDPGYQPNHLHGIFTLKMP